MKAWQRGAGLVGLAIAVASIDARVARPQEDDKPQAAEPEDGGVPPAPAPPAIPTGAVPSDPAARAGWLGDELKKVIRRHPELGRAKVGVAFVDVDTGKLVWGQDEGGRYNLASCTKLLTSSAALARLGPGFTWRTAIYAQKLDVATGTVDGDLYVRGRGDPTLDAAALRELAVDVRRAGVKRVTGRLIVDDSWFDDAVDPPHYMDQPKEQSGYRAPVGAFGAFANATTVVVEPDPAGVGLATISLEPPASDYVKVTDGSVVTTVTTGRNHVRVDSRVVGDHLELTVTGEVRADEGVDTTRRRIGDPARFAGYALRAALVDEGLTIGKRVERGVVPPGARQLAAHESLPLADVVRDMNKYSNNFYAESILKTLGAESKAPPAPPPVPVPGAARIVVAGPIGPHASWDDGLAVVRDFLVHDVGLTAGSFRIDNGSGLYGASDVTPLQLAQVVAHAEHDFRYGPDLIASLAIAGVDGTLRKRFAGTEGAGRVRAKTGTLSNVSTLGGLIAVDGRHPLAFAILLNDVPDGARPKARVLEDELLGAALAYLEP